MSNNLTGDKVILNLKPYILITAFLKIEHKLLERQHCIYLPPTKEDRMFPGSRLLTGCHPKMKDVLSVVTDRSSNEGRVAGCLQTHQQHIYSKAWTLDSRVHLSSFLRALPAAFIRLTSCQHQ